jgi:hypothetical protein
VGFRTRERRTGRPAPAAPAFDAGALERAAEEAEGRIRSAASALALADALERWDAAALESRRAASVARLAFRQDLLDPARRAAQDRLDEARPRVLAAEARVARALAAAPHKAEAARFFGPRGLARLDALARVLPAGRDADLDAALRREAQGRTCARVLLARADLDAPALHDEAAALLLELRAARGAITKACKHASYVRLVRALAGHDDASPAPALKVEAWLLDQAGASLESLLAARARRMGGARRPFEDALFGAEGAARPRAGARAALEDLVSWARGAHGLEGAAAALGAMVERGDLDVAAGPGKDADPFAAPAGKGGAPRAIARLEGTGRGVRDLLLAAGAALGEEALAARRLGERRPPPEAEAFPALAFPLVAAPALERIAGSAWGGAALRHEVVVDLAARAFSGFGLARAEEALYGAPGERIDAGDLARLLEEAERETPAFARAAGGLGGARPLFLAPGRALDGALAAVSALELFGRHLSYPPAAADAYEAAREALGTTTWPGTVAAAGVPAPVARDLYAGLGRALEAAEAELARF